MRRNIVLLIAAVLFIGMGCAGGADEAGGPGGNFVNGGAGSPGGSGPFFTPGGSGEAEDEGEPAPPPGAPGRANNDNPACFDDDSPPEGLVGDSYAFTLEAQAGTPPYTYQLNANDRLPPGLGLSPSGVISGRPGAVGEFLFRVNVTDAAGEDKRCLTRVTVRETFGVDVTNIFSLADEAWMKVLRVGVSSPGENDDFHWNWRGDVSKFCFGTIPLASFNHFNAARANCTAGDVVESGKVAYVFLKDDLQDGTEVTLHLTVSSDLGVEVVEKTLTFHYSPAPDCGNNIREGNEVCDGTAVTAGYECSENCREEKKIPARVFMTFVTLWTGDAGNDSSTDCNDVSIKFCKDASMDSGCTAAIPLDDPEDGDDRERGDKNEHLIYSPLYHMTEEHKYFQIKLGSGCADDTSWLLQGIEVMHVFGVEQPVAPYGVALGESMPPSTYFNPCVEMWMSDGDAINFGPDDTAVCAIITTATKDKAGTNDTVSLVLSNFEASAEGFVSTSISSWSSHFTILAGNGGSSPDRLALEMNWNGDDDGNDFEEGDAASYGSYLNGVKPYTRAPTFYIQKSGDGSSGGWCLHSAEVFVFQPGKFLNVPALGEDESKVYYDLVSYGDTWIDDEHSLGSLPHTLSEASPDVVTIDIGQHWEDG